MTTDSTFCYDQGGRDLLSFLRWGRQALSFISCI